MTITSSYKPHYPSFATAQRHMQETQQQRDAIAHPTSIRYSEFASRNLKAEIAAGRCIVMKTYPRQQVIIDLIHMGGNSYTAILADGQRILTGAWANDLRVEWKAQPVHLWQPHVAPHPLDAELFPPIEPAFTWHRHPEAIHYKSA